MRLRGNIPDTLVDDHEGFDLVLTMTFTLHGCSRDTQHNAKREFVEALVGLTRYDGTEFTIRSATLVPSEQR